MYRETAKRMKIAFVTPEFVKKGKLHPGGLATYLYTTGKALIAKGHEVTVFLAADNDEEFTYQGFHVISRKIRLNRVEKIVYNLVNRRIPKSCERFFASRQIRDCIRKEQKKKTFDILHYTNWKAIGLFPAKGKKLIRISSYEKYWDNNPEFRSWDKKICRWMEERSYKKFSNIIGPGDYLASIIKADLKLRSEIQILPTPVDLHFPKSERNFRRKGLKLVVCAGSVSRIKGHDLLFSIIRSYLEKFNDVYFLVSGKLLFSNGKSFEPDIENLKNDFPDHFEFFKHLDRGDLIQAFHQADLSLIPSLIDNFPNTALESMAQGTPVMASNTASLGILIQHGYNGFIIKNRNTDDWVSAIRDYLFHTSEYDQDILRQNITSSLEPFHVNKAVLSLEKYYQSISS